MFSVHCLLSSVLPKITEVFFVLLYSIRVSWYISVHQHPPNPSEVSNGTEIEGLSDPLPQLWVSPCPTLTLSLIKTGDTSGAVSTDSHLQTLYFTQHKESGGTVVRCVWVL